MSVEVMSLVWKTTKGSSEKLAMLALADWCNDQEEACILPLTLPENQCQRIPGKKDCSRVDQRGYLDVIGNPTEESWEVKTVSNESKNAIHLVWIYPGTDVTTGTDARFPGIHARDLTHDT